MKPATATVFLALCLAAASADVGQKHRNELKDHYDHLAYIADFPCHRPQPRVISVHKMFPDTHGKAYFPDVTVLHRCDEETGCCTEGKTCHPVRSDPVDLPFKVTFLDDHEGHRRGSWVIEYYTLHNHTECACGEPDHYEDNQKPYNHGHGGRPGHEGSPGHEGRPGHEGHHGSQDQHVGSSSPGQVHHESEPSYGPRPRPPYSAEQKRTPVAEEVRPVTEAQNEKEEEPEVCEAENEASEPENVKRESSSPSTTVSTDVADLLAAINT